MSEDDRVELVVGLLALQRASEEINQDAATCAYRATNNAVQAMGYEDGIDIDAIWSKAETVFAAKYPGD